MAAFLYPPLFFPLGAIVVGQMFLAPYLAAEHTGLPSEGSIYARTRSMKSNALFRFFFWNMPYHAAHHAYPAVPFHRLPALQRQIEARLVHQEPSYVGLHLRVMMGLKLVPPRGEGS